MDARKYGIHHKFALRSVLSVKQYYFASKQLLTSCAVISYINGITCYL